MAAVTTGGHMNALADALRAELAHMTSDLIHTEKAHFAAAQKHLRLHRVLGLVATVAGALAAAAIVSETNQTAAALLALVASLSSGVVTFVKPQEKAQQHLDAGRDLGALRVQVRQTHDLDLVAGTPDALAHAREAARRYAQEKAAIDRAAPAITDATYRTGKAKIDAGDFTP
jgi:hypothetical protein